MRETIDVGIHLGTAGSAVAVAGRGGVRVVKNDEGRDRTPSAVWMPRAGTVRVGFKARQHAGTDPEDAHTGFVARLGAAGAAYRFRRAGVSLTPEQLSAEVLMSLRRDVAHETGEPPAAAVVTVPAGCSPDRADATRAAAALAGLGPACPLLPEPVAAALAYGADGAPAYRAVFALDADHFWAAVVEQRGGGVRLLGHAADPHLGGRDIDRALVDEILAPAAARELRLPDFTRVSTRWATNFAKLAVAAEQAKADLSRETTTELLIDLKDHRGDEHTYAHTLTRDTLDLVAHPLYARAVELCRRALADSSLHPHRIDRLLLVGGATLAPGLRHLLADPRDGLAIPLDHSQDPTTALARGAALHAAALPARAARPGGSGAAVPAGLLDEVRTALGNCEDLLARARWQEADRLRTLAARLHLALDRYEDEPAAARPADAAAVVHRLLRCLRRLEAALIEDPEGGPPGPDGSGTPPETALP